MRATPRHGHTSCGSLSLETPTHQWVEPTGLWIRTISSHRANAASAQYRRTLEILLDGRDPCKTGPNRGQRILGEGGSTSSRRSANSGVSLASARQRHSPATSSTTGSTATRATSALRQRCSPCQTAAIERLSPDFPRSPTSLPHPPPIVHRTSLETGGNHASMTAVTNTQPRQSQSTEMLSAEHDQSVPDPP